MKERALKIGDTVACNSKGQKLSGIVCAAHKNNVMVEWESGEVVLLPQPTIGGQQQKDA